jgi:phage terminase small subunit
MARPSKPTGLILLEGKSHRTKAEIECRKENEEALTTGIHMEKWPEVRANVRASKEFDRVCELLKTIGKDDALHESVVNRYCLLRAECVQFEEKRETFYRGIKQMEKEYKEQEPEIDEETGKLVYALPASQYYKLLHNMQGNIINLDKQIMAKRKMMLDIEKENIMTIASVLRSIPKTPPKEEKKTGMAAYLAKRAGGDDR